MELDARSRSGHRQVAGEEGHGIAGPATAKDPLEGGASHGRDSSTPGQAGHATNAGLVSFTATDGSHQRPATSPADSIQYDAIPLGESQGHRGLDVVQDDLQPSWIPQCCIGNHSRPGQH